MTIPPIIPRSYLGMSVDDVAQHVANKCYELFMSSTLEISPTYVHWYNEDHSAIAVVMTHLPVKRQLRESLERAIRRLFEPPELSLIGMPVDRIVIDHDHDQIILHLTLARPASA